MSSHFDQIKLSIRSIVDQKWEEDNVEVPNHVSPLWQLRIHPHPIPCVSEVGKVGKDKSYLYTCSGMRIDPIMILSE